jgi:P4 family phage/plasmid primase-like protien
MSLDDSVERARYELLAAAQAYHELGVPVVPFKLTLKENGEYDKRPRVQWAKWETEPQTDEVFNALDWSDMNALGVVLGTQAKNGLYLAAIDYDTKGQQLSEEVKAKGKELLSEFPITKTEQTVNKGIHQIYWSRQKPKTDGTFHDAVALELLGEKKLCLMSPSAGYLSLNDNMPTEVESIDDVFYGILRKHGYRLSEDTETQNQMDNYGFQLEKLVDLSQLTKIGNDEYQGSHPFHDSTTEKNFTVNVRTNQWYCFRHSSGGGALQYLAMKEGIIRCEQAKKGALRGAKFKQVLQIAVSQGLLDEKLINSQSEINPIILAKDIKEDYRFIVEKETGLLYFYDAAAGIYSDKVEQLIKREVVKRLDENTKARYYVEIENYITHSAPMVEMNASPELIAVKNGVLNVLKREHRPFSPDYYLTQKLPVTYDATAQCPAITKFLNEILPEKKQQMIVQEYVGYTLYRKMTHHVCLLFVGVGRNGKSKLLELIMMLLGKDNVSNQTIQSLCYNRFSLAELHNKLANISADLPSKELANTGIFKMIVGGDRLPGEHKHKDPFYFSNIAKLLFSCNRIPPIPSTEACLAYYSRFVIVEFKNIFTGKKADKRIMEKLTTDSELSGFLNYALEGLKRVEEQKDFTEHMTQEETEKTYVKLSNSAQAYIIEKIQVTDEYTDFILTDDLYRDFITYCHEEKIQTLPKAAFTKAMQEHCNGAERTKIRPSKTESPISAWRYVKFVPAVPRVPALQTILADKEINVSAMDSGKLVSDSGTSGTSGTKSESEKTVMVSLKNPDFLWRRIPTTELCETCGQRDCEFEINDIHGRQILRRCESCFHDMQSKFSGAAWKEEVSS